MCLSRIRAWDRRAGARVSRFIVNSELTGQRVAACYGRESTVIHPPVEVERFRPAEPEDYFLVVAELVPHKRVDVALEAARRAGRRIKVVGEGPELGRLRSAYGRSAEFLGRVSAEQLATLYARARALVVPNVEEFGIAAVETGVLVGPQPDELAAAMRGVDFERFEPERTRAWAMQFSTERFKERLVAEVSASSTVVT